MYYHVYIDLSTDKARNDIFYVDITDKEFIISKMVLPYLKGERFFCKGNVILPKDVKRFNVVRSEISSDTWYKTREDSSLTLYGPDAIVFSKKMIDITDEIIALANQKINDMNGDALNTRTRSDKKVFVVHGHDSALLNDVARFISSCDLEPIILDEQPSQGQTIIEKLESNTDVNFAIALYTPCDIGNEKTNDTMKLRARQNVIFEHGYTVAKLGRKNVCALLKGELELPTDISGIIYIKVDEQGAWKTKLVKEIKAAGLKVNTEKFIDGF